MSSHDSIESTDGTPGFVAQATQRGATDERAAARTWTASGVFLSRLVYTTSYVISYGVVFTSVLVARTVPVNNAAVRGLIEGAQAARHKVDQLSHSAPGSSTVSSSPAIAPA